jgi:hypothetical protein
LAAAVEAIAAVVVVETAAAAAVMEADKTAGNRRLITHRGRPKTRAAFYVLSCQYLN